MSSSSWILFYVSANDCINCKKMNVYWGTIQSAIKEVFMDKIMIETIVYPERKNPTLDLSKYPMDLLRYIQWFPTFILVEKSHFEAVREKKVKQLKASVFNGEVPEEMNLPVREVPKGTGKAMTSVSFISWIESEMARLSSPSTPIQPPSIYHNPPITQAIHVSEPEIHMTSSTCSKYKLKSRFSRS